MKKIIFTLFICLVALSAQAQTVMTVGATGATYTTLKAAFDVINAAGTGITYHVQIVDNTTETASASLSKAGVTVLLYPTVTGKKISAVTTPTPLDAYTVSLSAVSNLTIDGRLRDGSGVVTGSTADLTIENANTGGSSGTINFGGDSDNNKITYCIIKGSSKQGETAGGIIRNGGNTGQSNNEISYNKITASNGVRPTNNAIYLHDNTTGLKISNNSFENVVAKNGIRVRNLPLNIEISGNSFYETGSFTVTGIASYININGTDAKGVSISNNYIGGSEPQCAGGAMTKSGGSDRAFNGILVSSATSTGITISNNTIQNISWTNNGNAEFCAINFSVSETSAGSNSISNIHSNFISNITAINSAAEAKVVGIAYYKKNVAIYNNIISLGTNHRATIWGIRLSDTAPGTPALANCQVYNNTVYIAGEQPNTGSELSYAFRAGTNSGGYPRDIRNNIFYNARTTQAGGLPSASKHYCAYFATVAGTLTCNYNNYFTSSTGFAGFNGTADVAYNNSIVVGSQDLQSSVATPNIASPGSTAISYKGTTALAGTTISAVTTDYAGTARTTQNMGAYYIASGATPTITGTATATAFATTYGTASTKQDFTVTSTDLTADITATAPTGFEVASDGTTFGTTATLSKNTSAELSLRLKANAAVSGSYNNVTVSLASTGATTKYITTASSGNSVSAKALTISGLTGANKPYDGNTTASFTGTAAYSGIVNGDSETVTGTPSASFATATAGDGKTITVTGYSAPSGNYTLTQPTLSGNITKVALTITAANQTVAYGTLATTVTGAGTYTPAGFVNGETATVIGGGPVTYTTNFTNTTAASTSGITITPNVGSLTATNYSFTPVNGSITISEADVTVSNPNIFVSDLILSPVSNITVNPNGSLVIDESKQIASVTLNAGANLSVADGQTLTLTNLTLKSNNSGTSTYVPSGTLKNGTLTVTGTTSVEQYLATTRNWYVSSPVSNAVAPAGYTYYGRYEPGGTATGWTPVSVGAGLVAGKGYIALPSAPKAGLPITFTTQTEGTLNNGTITIPLTYTSSVNSGKGYNLIGNPYPSHLSWTYAFTQANASKIESTIWYRTNSGSSNASGWSFVTFNPTSGATVPSTANGGIIPPMQAFWVLAKDVPGNSIQFTNDMRSHQTGNPLRTPAANNADRQKIRLQLNNGVNTDEALILFDANASDSYDAYDSPKMMINAADLAEIYTVLDAKKLVINGLNSVSNNMILPLGYNVGAESSLTLKVSEMANFDSNTRVYLVDGATEIELAQGTEYTFNTAKITGNESRFSLLFRAPGAVTGINSAEKLNANVYVNDANHITIVAPVKSNYAIYNALGMLIENGVLNTKHETRNAKHAAGVYVVKVGNETKRVIIK